MKVDGKLKARLLLVCGVMVVGLSLLSARLVYVQVVQHGKYAEAAAAHYRHKEVLPGSRGMILDRNGDLLARNQTVYTLFADCHHLRDPLIGARGVALKEGIGPRTVKMRYTREEIVGKNSLSMLVANQATFTADNEGEAYELQIRRKDGEKITVLVTPRRIEDEDGTYRGGFHLIVDVTRQRHALDVLTKSKRKLEGVFHASPAASLLIDAATNAVLDVNEAFISLTGFSRDAIVGSGGFGLADYEDLDDLNRMVSLLKERVARSTEIRLRIKDGESQPFTVEVREIVVDDEELLLLILTRA